MSINKKRAYIFTWVVVLYVGSLLSQFSPAQDSTMWALWGFLIAGAVLISSVFIDWQSHLVRRLHSLFLLVLSVVYVLIVLGNTVDQFALLTQVVTPFVWWSLFLSLVYVALGLRLHSRLFYYFAIISFISLPFYFYSPLQNFLPLLFVFSQATLLIFAAI